MDRRDSQHSKDEIHNKNSQGDKGDNHSNEVNRDRKEGNEISRQNTTTDSESRNKNDDSPGGSMHRQKTHTSHQVEEKQSSIDRQKTRTLSRDDESNRNSPVESQNITTQPPTEQTHDGWSDDEGIDQRRDVNQEAKTESDEDHKTKSSEHEAELTKSDERAEANTDIFTTDDNTRENEGLSQEEEKQEEGDRTDGDGQGTHEEPEPKQPDTEELTAVANSAIQRENSSLLDLYAYEGEKEISNNDFITLLNKDQLQLSTEIQKWKKKYITENEEQEKGIKEMLDGNMDLHKEGLTDEEMAQVLTKIHGLKNLPVAELLDYVRLCTFN